MRYHLFFASSLAAMLFMATPATADERGNRGGEKSDNQGNSRANDQRGRGDDGRDNGHSDDGRSDDRRGSSGEFFVTTATGAVMSGNRFSSKCAVYLDGGAGPHSPSKARGLADGDYYFQVTDPSGQMLLSTDPVSNRKLHVTGGVITAFAGTGGAPHSTGKDGANGGAMTIQLATTGCPTDYLDTPNADSVYKAWVTPVESFVGKASSVDNPCGKGCFHGFMASKSKTDNFKTKAGSSASFCLTMQSQFNDGIATFPDLLGWGITVTDGLGVSNHYVTDSSTGSVVACQLSAGAYTVTEDPYDPATQTPPIMNACTFEAPGQSLLNGVVQPNAGSVAFNGSTQAVTVTFVNQIACLQ